MILLLAVLAAATSPVDTLSAGFIERYFAQYPTRATEAGRADRDGELEDLDPARVQDWLSFLATAEAEATDLHTRGGLQPDDAIDLEVLQNAIEQERFKLAVRKAPSRDPLLWAGVVSNAVIYLLLRDDQPLEARAAALASRARAVPRLVDQARRQLGATPPRTIAREVVIPAAQQARALAQLYGKGLAQFGAAASPGSRRALAEGGKAAADALNGLAGFLDALAAKASGSPWLGPDYAEAFRIGLRVAEPPARLLPRFERDLAELRAEAARYGRKVFATLVPGTPPPEDDKALLRRLFGAIEERHDTDPAEYVRSWQRLMPQLEKVVRERTVISLPEPRTLKVLPGPPWLAGQAYGGVFAAGPFRPEGQTLLLLPMPPPDADQAGRTRFFRAFNRPFSTMIAAHETIPGHYVQLKIAARQPRPIRAIFPDLVYAEGWGTFSERLMLDQGWGGAPERIAHLKKQLENCARAIVDIRAHTAGMSREEVVRFVQDEALQDAQLAANLWQRTLTSAPQLVTYHLGFRQIDALYQRAKERPGFALRSFTDQLMSLGAVPLSHYEWIGTGAKP